jgi:hypothetical protein
LQRNTKIFLLLLVVAIVAIGALAYTVDLMIPPKVVKVVATFGGSDETLIVVEYWTDKPLRENILSDKAYLIVQDTGEFLHVKGVPKIGPMISQSVGKTTGWFVIDNEFNQASSTTPITVVIGEYRQANFTILSTI